MSSELVELVREAEELRRSTHVVLPVAQASPWFRIEAKAGDPKTAEVWIYDRIGSDFFDEGISAKSFVRQVNALKVDEIVLHINSPGGDFFDGVTIYNALKDHPATVTAVVDGLAASAASFIAQAGDTRRMNRAAQMMIHDASGGAVGNAGDMADFAKVLGKVSDSIAGIYASRAGGTAADWRKAMRAETWYTAAETVEAGLADETADEDSLDPPVRNTWDLAIFNYAGRQAAPPPVMPSASARPETPAPAAVALEKGAGMTLAKYREALAGLPDNASEEDVRNALASAGLIASQSAPPADPPQPPAPSTPPTPPPPVGDPKPEPTPEPGSQELDQKIAAAAANRGVITLDASQAAQFQEGMRRAQALAARLDERDRDETITEAIKVGKFPPSRRAHYEAYWNADREGAKTLIASLAPGLVPVTAAGYADAGEDAMWDAEYRGLFPPAANGRGR